MGSGTTALAARRLGRHFVGFELNPAYCEIIQQRLAEPEAPVKKRAGAARKKAPTVVPAQAGTHTEAALTLSMDPRLRGDDGLAANEQNVDNDIDALTTQGTTP
jgi:site-specific DNA-methyltransferase (adenine-specific)